MNDRRWPASQIRITVCRIEDCPRHQHIDEPFRAWDDINCGLQRKAFQCAHWCFKHNVSYDEPERG